MQKKVMLAVDLGAESGRVIAGLPGEFDVLHRFPSRSCRINGHLKWDILGIFMEIKEGLKKAFQKYGDSVISIGIDTWGVDFSLFDKDGDMLFNPYHYRDERTNGISREVFKKISWPEIYEESGIQLMEINSLFQLYALSKEKPDLLKQAEHFLTIPDILNYWLSGKMFNEFSNATTTQLFNTAKMQWSSKILKSLNLPEKIFKKPIMPGSIVGQLKKELVEELGACSRVDIIAPACHDTGSAVAAVPVSGNEDWAYIATGTWCLVGIESDRVLISEESREANFTNEGGVENTVRFLRNTMGLWLVQRLKKDFGKEYDYDRLTEEAGKSEAFHCLINPDDKRFLNPMIMTGAIDDFCYERNQAKPETPGQYVRCVLESLAMEFHYVLEKAEKASGKKIKVIYMVGGGSKSKPLCQMTANASGKKVLAGMAEATANGNLLMQAKANGLISSLVEGRRALASRTEMAEYLSQDKSLWQEKYKEFLKLKEINNE